MGDLRLPDRIEIQDCLHRYVRGVDRRNWDLVRSAYHPDAFDDHGNYKGGIDGFIESLIARHATIEQSMHVLSNVMIAFDGPDSALAESCFITHQRIGPAAGDARLAYLRGGQIRPDQAVETEVIGRYVDRMARRDGAWRIARRTVVYEVFRGQPAPTGGGLRDNWALSQRDGNDPIEVAHRDLGLPPS
ncbi:MAG TPA: nuclear transport factor 2 family protein [Acetobacteraceae bacterium]